jgi:hypothetical protein
MATTTTVRVSNWTLALAAECYESRLALNVAGPLADVRHDMLADAMARGGRKGRLPPTLASYRTHRSTGDKALTATTIALPRPLHRSR